MLIEIGDKVFDTHKENTKITMSKIEKDMLIRLLNEYKVKEYQLLKITLTNIK